MALPKHKCVSTHAEEVDGGRFLAPGEVAPVDPKDEHNQRLIDEGKLVEVPTHRKAVE